MIEQPRKEIRWCDHVRVEAARPLTNRPIAIANVLEPSVVCLSADWTLILCPDCCDQMIVANSLPLIRSALH
jgi:hypothetical protein